MKTRQLSTTMQPTFIHHLRQTKSITLRNFSIILSSKLISRSSAKSVEKKKKKKREETYDPTWNKKSRTICNQLHEIRVFIKILTSNSRLGISLTHSSVGTFGRRERERENLSLVKMKNSIHSWKASRDFPCVTRYRCFPLSQDNKRVAAEARQKYSWSCLAKPNHLKWK